jgi:hypothetical protein
LASGERAASSPPIRPEKSVIGITLARVISSQRDTPSIAREDDRFCVSRISHQFRREPSIVHTLFASLRTSERG